MILEPEKFDKARNVQLEILLEFDRICKKFDIHYNIYFGTLLGAIRHEGFIPWDDDIDVAMTRENYNRFIEVSKNNIDKKYFVQTYETDHNFFRPYMRIRKNNTLYVQRHYEHLDIHHGVFIDIFPFDYVYEDKRREFIRYNYLSFLRKLSIIKYFGVKKDSKKLKKKIQKFIDKLIPGLKFNRYLEKIITIRKDTGYLNLIADYATLDNFDKYLIKECDFLDSKLHLFEGYKFPIPKKYDEVLSHSYGNYMDYPPKEQRIPLHQVNKIEL